MLIHHLKKDQSLAKKYQDPIEWYIGCIEKGYARKVGKKTASIKSEKMWYFPHHPDLTKIN